MNRIYAIIKFLVAFGTVLLVCCEATGQTAAPSTRPTPPQWDRTMQGLVTAATDEDSLQAMLTTNCIFGKFSGERNSDARSLIDYLSSRTVIGIHAYLSPPQRMAIDIDADVNASQLVSDRVKKDMALDDPILRNAATGVAIKWAEQSLGAVSDMPMGIIVLWDGHSDIDDSHRLTFVLIRGQEVSEGEFRITTMIWGDPVQ